MYSVSAAISIENTVHMDNHGNTKCPSLPRYHFQCWFYQSRIIWIPFFFTFKNMHQDTLFTAVDNDIGIGQ